MEQKALWDVIAGRMGFVQFSGTETEPAKSGPGVAQQLAHIYKELLAAFDHYYISSAVGSSKRPRDEEMTLLSNALSPGDGPFGATDEPSPTKRVKTEWDAPTSDALKEKTEAVENIKTKEDASVYLGQMAELIKKAADIKGQESFLAESFETFEMILEGYHPTPDGGSSLLLQPRELGDLREPSPPAGLYDKFSGMIDDEAETPELAWLSSTDTSPFDIEEGLFSTNGRSESAGPALYPPEGKDDVDDDGSLDPFTPLLTEELFGGEAPYYQTSEWKWDSSMPSMGQWTNFSS